MTMNYLVIIIYFLSVLFIYTHNIFASDVLCDGNSKNKATHKGKFTHEPDIFINSDTLNINQDKNIVNFAGKVILWFDDMVLKTDKIEIIYNKATNKKEIDKVVIPNKLTALRTIEQEILIADSAEYFAATGKLTLNGNVKLQHKDDIVSTNKFIYHTNLKAINQDQ
jgi:lipopolysaccharide transport protein LptA